MAQFVDSILKDESNKVVVFSKSYCPYCAMAKQTLDSVGVKYKVIELDQEQCDVEAIQKYLGKITGGRTVPRVFIDGKCIGGGTETKAMHNSGELVTKLKECGAI